MSSFPERDWKVFRKLHPVALERFCQRVLDEVQQTISASDKSSHQRYGELYKLVKDRDHELASAFDDYRRSTALIQLRIFHGHKLLTEQELSQLSDETREYVVRNW